MVAIVVQELPVITDINAQIMQQASYIASPTLDDLFATDAETRRMTDQLIAPF